MTSSDVTPAVSRPLRPDAEVVSQALSILHLFADRPTLRETARRTLQQVLDDRFPGFDIPVATAVVLEPRRSETPKGSSFASYQSHGLTDLLLESYWKGSCRVFSDESFLSRYANVETPSAIDVELSEILEVLDEWGPHLLECYQQELAAFWSQSNEGDASPWQQLRNLFQEQLRMASQALVGDALLTVQGVLDYPDNALRETAQGDAATEAAVTLVCEDSSTLMPDDVLVLSMRRKVEGRTIALLFTLTGGIEVFSSEEAMTQSWFGARQRLSLSNYWAEHDIFDALTLSLLERQLQIIATIKPAVFVDLPTLERRLEQISSPTTLLGAFRSGHEARLSTLKGLLPSWLKQASPVQRAAYSRLLATLAARNRTGTSFLSGIVPIHEYAEQALKALMVEDDPARRPVRVRDIEVVQQRLENSAFEIIDPPFPEPRYQSIRSAFAQLAVKNVGALPRVPAQILYRSGEPPLWLTYDYLRELTNRADLGQRYPDMLQRKLLDVPQEFEPRREQFHASMCIQLPLLALELRIRNRLTDLAYRQVVAALQPDAFDRQVEGQAMVVRPLGFQTGADSRKDYVLNMFVIGPQALGRGPYILYRPASVEPMLEFVSWAALLSAIQEDPSLQGSVLAGLAPSVHHVYANGGFVEPHVGRVVFGDFDALLPQRVSLASEALSEDVFSALYRACAQALIRRAKDDSVSNSEARWDQLKDFGWALFNLLQPLLDGPFAAMGLLVQLTKSVEVFVQSEHPENRWSAAADVLMNLALILVHSGSPVRSIARAEVSGVVRETALEQRIQLANNLTRPASAVPVKGKTRLFYGWTGARGQLSARQLAKLDTFKLPAPPRESGLVNSGEFRGLYRQDGYWYACVEDDWFRVSPTLEGAVITDPKGSLLRGPWLKSDEQGRWSFDFRLRLLGGAELSVRAKRKLKKLEKNARELLAGYDRKVADARRMSKTTHSPADVESLIMDQADPFDAAAANIEQLTRPVGEESLQPAVDQLREAATRLRELAQQTRIEMYKLRNPTAGAVEYLLGKEEISIRKIGGRTDSSAGKGTDFLQEYEIRDPGNNVLWYAHFHYRTKVAAPDSFIKAHLKTAAQRRLGLNFQKDQQAAGHAVTSIWRGEISPTMAKQVFFHL